MNYRRTFYYTLCTLVVFFVGYQIAKFKYAGKEVTPILKQSIKIEGIVASVEDEPILYTELEAAFLQANDAQTSTHPISKQNVLKTLLINKLLLVKAQQASQEPTPPISIDEKQVSTILTQQIASWIRQAGSRQAVEAYFQKPLSEIKKELRIQIKEALLIERFIAYLTRAEDFSPERISLFVQTQKTPPTYHSFQEKINTYLKYQHEEKLNAFFKEHKECIVIYEPAYQALLAS